MANQYKKNLVAAFKAAELKKKSSSKSQAASRMSKTKKQAPLLFDLVNSDDEMSDIDVAADDDEYASVTDKQAACYKALDIELRSCQKCSKKGMLCKLTADAEHLAPTAQELSLWAMRMVSQGLCYAKPNAHEPIR